MVFRNLFITFIVFFSLSCNLLKSQNVRFSTSQAGNNHDYSQAIAIDSTGNIFVIGNFESSSISFNNGYSLNNLNTTDCFLAKYNSSGLCQWVQLISGNSDNQVISVAIDQIGNVYVVGWYSSTSLSFNNNIELNNTALHDGFIAKYNSDGICQWAQNIFSNGWDRPQSVAIDFDGNILVSGYFVGSSTLNFNNGIILNRISPGDAECFLSKYDNNGFCLWAEDIGGEGDDRGYRLSIDKLNNIYLTGYFTSPTLYFNNNVTLINSGVSDKFITKYNSDGLCLWAQKISNQQADFMNCISSDYDGNIYVSGRFNVNQIFFNNNISLINYSNIDGYLVKYNSSGNCEWAQRISGLNDDDVYSLTNDALGNVYILGAFFSNVLNFNNGKTLSLSINGNSDAFVAKYNSSGDCIWAKSINGNGYDFPLNIAISSNLDIFIVGYSGSNPLYFGNNSSLSLGYGAEDGFLVKFNQLPLISTTSISSIDNTSANSGGNITDDGGSTVSQRGVVWSTSANPTISSNLGMTNDGTGTGSFISNISGLNQSTLYHVRAYATNSSGTAYGSDVSFTTIPTLPQWGLITLGGLIVIFGSYYLRKFFV